MPLALLFEPAVPTIAAGAPPTLPDSPPSARCMQPSTSTGNVTLYSPVVVRDELAPVVPRARVPSLLTTAHMMRGPQATAPLARTVRMALPLPHVPLTRRCSRAAVSPSRRSALRLRTFVWLRPTASGGV